MNDYEEQKQKKLEEKLAQAGAVGQNQMLQKAALFVVAGLIIGGSVWYIGTAPQTPGGVILARTGLHWHTTLTITIKGEKQEIPTDIGIGVVHQTMHTHDATGVIHLEFPGLVRETDTTLGRFFSIWGKQFTKECIFDRCTGPEGKLIMKVNGVESSAYGEYLMKDGDKIDIIYE